jgi:hypothetical protein
MDFCWLFWCTGAPIQTPQVYPSPANLPRMIYVKYSSRQNLVKRYLWFKSSGCGHSGLPCLSWHSCKIYCLADYKKQFSSVIALMYCQNYTSFSFSCDCFCSFDFDTELGVRQQLYLSIERILSWYKSSFTCFSQGRGPL